jgi:hypothetical protein
VNIQIEYKYNPADYVNKEDSLRMSYYDESSGQWQFMESYADPATGYLIGVSNHLTLFDVTSTTLQGYKLPDLSSFDTSLATGAATYSYPIDVPTGPAGLKPSLTLTYNSQIADGSSYRTQSSWVGMSFELEGGSITRDTRGTDSLLYDDTFTMNLAGGSWLLMPLTKNTSVNPQYEDFYTENANFMRIRRFLKRCNPRGYDQDAGFWQVWDISGNQYFFGYYTGAESSSCTGDNSGVNSNQTAWAPAYKYYHDAAPTLENWEWGLTKIVNIYGQQLSYSYNLIHVANARNDNCDNCYLSDSILSIYLREIDYPNNLYRIYFDRQSRFDFDPHCDDAAARCVIEKERLLDIKIQSNPDRNSNYQNAVTVRRYKFNYQEGIIFPNVTWPQTEDANHNLYGGGKTTTLLSVQEYANDSDTLKLPPISFSYGDGMHLTSATNGYNGKVVFVYEDQTSEISVPKPWPYPSTTGVKAADPKQNGRYYVIMPGGMYWISATIATTRSTDVTFHLHGWNNDQNPNADTQITVPAGTNDYSVNAKLPITVSAWTDSNPEPPDYSQSLYIGITCSPNCSSVTNLNFGALTTRYRVFEKHVYPDAAQSTYNNYQYAYEGPSLNTSTLAVASTGYNPTNDFVKAKLIHIPYSQFRGHSTVTETFPDGHKIVSTFLQTDTKQMMPSEVKTYDNSTPSVLLTDTLYTYNEVFLPIDSSVQGDLPKCGSLGNGGDYVTCKDARIFWTAISAAENRVYDSSGNYLATRTEYYYDTVNNIPTYGNLLRTINSEWVSGGWVNNDMQVFTYNPNAPTSALYLVGLPGSQKSFQCGSSCGAGTNPAIADTISEVDFLYDGNTNPAAFPAPTAGKVTAKRTLLYFNGGDTNSPRFQDQIFSYDSYGNVNSTTVYKGEGTSSSLAATGGETTTSCYGSYPTSPNTPTCNNDYYGSFLGWIKTSPDGTNYQVSYYEYDKGRELLIKETDPNGAVALADYDAFGRLIKIAKPGDTLASPTFQISYFDPPDPNPSYLKYYTQVSEKRSDGALHISRTEVYDGVGHVIQTQTPDISVSGSPTTVFVTTAYDNMGRSYRAFSPETTSDTTSILKTDLPPFFVPLFKLVFGASLRAESRIMAS